MKRFVLGLAATVASIALAPSANAAIVLGISVNNGAITTLSAATPGGVYVSTSGFASFSGVYTDASGNVYSISLNGQGFPTVSQPALNTSSLDFKQGASASGGSVQLFVTQTGLSSFNSFLMSSFNSNTFTGALTSATISSYYSASNALFGGTQLTSTAFSGFGGTIHSDPVNVAGLFSETIKYDLVAGAGSASFNGTANLAAVPEPATWGLMLLGFGAMGGMLRTRNRKARIRFA